jgi:hypothetical protein
MVKRSLKRSRRSNDSPPRRRSVSCSHWGLAFCLLLPPGYADLTWGQVGRGRKKRTYLHDISRLEQKVDARIVLDSRGALCADHRYGRLLPLFPG